MLATWGLSFWRVGGRTLVVDEDVLARHRLAVEHFVLRARRIESHSLWEDEASLLALSRVTVRLNSDQDGKFWLVKDLPPEEQIESAAARVRPLLEQKDDANLLLATGALKYFCRDMPSSREFLQDIEKRWRARTSRSASDRDQKIQMLSPDGPASAVLSDRELAFAYIYGDVVHHDRSHLELTEQFGVRQRYEHAAPLVAFIMIQAARVLSLARAAQARKLLGLPDEVFSVPVVVGGEPFRNEVSRAFVAPVGTPPPAEGSETLGSEWSSLLPEENA
jgi:hypothetical protein